jgi:hypothetical protein
MCLLLFAALLVIDLVHAGSRAPVLSQVLLCDGQRDGAARPVRVERHLGARSVTGRR